MLPELRKALEIVFVAVALLFVLGPCVVLIGGVWSNGEQVRDETAWQSVWDQGARTIALRNVSLAVTVTIGGLLFAVALAPWLRRLHEKQVAWMLPILLIPLLSDQLARNYGWYFLLRTEGVLNHVLGYAGVDSGSFQFLYRMETVAVVLFQGLFPLAVVPLFLSLLFVDRSVPLAAQTLGASKLDTLWRVTRPLFLPGFLLGLSFVFTASLGYYITPRMLGGDAGLTVAGLIDQRINLLFDWSGATALAAVLVCVCLPFLALFAHSLSRLEPIAGFAAVPSPASTPLPRPVSMATGVTLIGLVLLPLIPLVLASFGESASLTFPPQGLTLKWYGKALRAPEWADAWQVSFVVASVSAGAATLLGIGAALLAARSRCLATVGSLLVAIPLLVPPLAMAVGMYRVLTTLGLIDEWWRILVGHTVRTLPYTALCLLVTSKALDRNLLGAARVFGAGRLDAMMKALGPLLLPSLVSGYLLAWLASFFDLEYSLLLAGPATTTLPIQLWSGLHYSVEPTVAACATLTTAAGIVLLVVLTRMLLAWARTSSSLAVRL